MAKRFGRNGEHCSSPENRAAILVELRSRPNRRPLRLQRAKAIPEAPENLLATAS